MNNNIIELPTAKTYLHHHHKRPGPEAINLVYNNLRLTRKQARLLSKILALREQIQEALPPDKQPLFEKYIDMQLQDTCLSMDQAILWTINNEHKIDEVLAQ